MKLSKLFKKAAALLTAGILTTSALGTTAMADAYTDAASGVLRETASAIGQAWDQDLAQYAAIKDGFAGNIAINLHDGARSLISMFGLDLSWFNDIKINVTGKLDGARMYAKESYLLNDVAIADLDMLMDLGAGSLYMNLPDIIDKPVAINLYQAFNMAMSETGTDVGVDAGTLLYIYQILFQVLSNPEAYLLSGAQVETLVNRYGDIIISHMTNNHEVADTITIGAVTSDYTLMEGQILAADLVAVAKDAVAAAMTDPEIAAAIAKLAVFLPEGFGYETITQLLASVAQELEGTEMSTTPDDKIIARLWQNAAGDIQACQFAVMASGQGEIGRLTVLFPSTPAGSGLYVDVTANGQSYATISGTGTTAGNAFNGSYTVNVMGMNAIGFDVASVGTDINDMSQRITVYPLADVLTLMDESTAGMLSGLSVTFGATTTPGYNNTASLSAALNGTSLAEITMNAYPNPGVVIPDASAFAPAYDVMNEADAEALAANLNIGTLLERLYTAGAGDFINMLMGTSEEVAYSEVG